MCACLYTCDFKPCNLNPNELNPLPAAINPLSHVISHFCYAPNLAILLHNFCAQEAHTHTYTHTHTHTHTRVHIHTLTCTSTPAQTCTHIHMDMHAYAHTHTLKREHMHLQDRAGGFGMYFTYSLKDIKAKCIEKCGGMRLV